MVMDQANYFVSIIIPAYNAEKYIRDCLDSAFDAITASGFSGEVIVTNDGSTDTTGQILAGYASRDNFTLVVQENAGVSVARNNAMEHARGKYLFFLDSDDLVVKDGFVECLKFLSSDPQTDMLFFKVSGYGGKDTADSRFCPLNCTGQALIANFYATDGKGIRYRHYPKFYLRERFLENDLFYTPGVSIAEDRLWAFRALYYARNVRSIDAIAIYYREIVGSMSHNKNIMRTRTSLSLALDELITLSMKPSALNPAFKRTIENEIASMALELLLDLKDEDDKWDDEALTQKVEKILLDYGKSFTRPARKYIYVPIIKMFGIKAFYNFYMLFHK